MRMEIKNVSSIDKLKLKHACGEVNKLDNSSIEFTSITNLDTNHFYECHFVLWNDTKLHLIINITEKEKKETEFKYRGMFIGMTYREKCLIETYKIFNIK